MSMSDPISDMLTRIRNAQSVRKVAVSMPASTVKTGMPKYSRAKLHR
jgi:small subunit ribosomal protein S8